MPSLRPAFPRHLVSAEGLRASASAKRVETRPKLDRKQAKRGPKGGQKEAKRGKKRAMFSHISRPWVHHLWVKIIVKAWYEFMHLRPHLQKARIQKTTDPEEYRYTSTSSTFIPSPEAWGAQPTKGTLHLVSQENKSRGLNGVRIADESEYGQGITLARILVAWLAG